MGLMPVFKLSIIYYSGFLICLIGFCGVRADTHHFLSKQLTHAAALILSLLDYTQSHTPA